MSVFCALEQSVPMDRALTVYLPFCGPFKCQTLVGGICLKSSNGVAGGSLGAQFPRPALFLKGSFQALSLKASVLPSGLCGTPYLQVSFLLSPSPQMC